MRYRSARAREASRRKDFDYIYFPGKPELPLIKIGGIIVNNFITDASVGDSMLLKKRRQVQTKYIQILEEQYSEDLPLVKLPLQEYEVKGIDAIRRIERELYSLA